jgi:defect-in-organelle-trafficking protein DotB
MESKIFPYEPISLWLQSDFDALLCWLHENGFSDLSLGSSSRIFGRLGKYWHPISERETSADEGYILLDQISNNPGMSARVKGGDPDVNFTYEIKNNEGRRLRFRVSATSVRDGYSSGINIIMRTIASTPPTMEKLDIEPEIIDNFFPDNGLILLTGVMGTGKSTTLAAGMRKIIEKGGRLVLTFEAPIEYDLMALPNKKGQVFQSEIPTHLPDFNAAVKNVMRRAANVCMLGEARDRNELHSMIELPGRGVATYSTLHTHSVYDAIPRILNSFPQEERHAEATALYGSIHMIIQQRLIPRADNPDKQVGVREWVIFNEDDKDLLKRTPIEDISKAVKKMVIDRGTDLLTQTEKLFAKGLITEDSFNAIKEERTNKESVDVMYPS